ncbi:MAG: hypothetical protein ACM3N0_06985 [Chloroflexota bacterium]
MGLGTLQAAAARHRQIHQSDLLLRLHDLPPGYVNVELREEQGERTFCMPLKHPPGTPRRLAKFVVRFRPKGCVGAYNRLFVVPGQLTGPVFAATGALRLSSNKAADAAWHVVPQLLGRLLKDHPPREVTTSDKVGRATRLFHVSDQPRFYPLFYKIGHRTSFLVWRSGNTLAVVMTIGESFAEIDPQAVRFARRQQVHIRKPTRYTRAEKFDGEVALDDPSLETPAYWLGRNFRPGHGLPDNRLFGAFALDGSEEEVPGALLGIWYGQIRLYTWTQATWAEYAGTPEAHAIASWHCTKKKTIELPSGYATIYGGYKKSYRGCPSEPPNAFTARVYNGDLVIAVNPIEVELPDPPGFPPSGPFIETANPYGSFKGMEAIVRSMHLRPKRIF